MKNRFIAALLAIFLGGFGVHKFYLGKWNGIFYLLLCWTYVPVIIAFIEGVLYLVNGEEAFDKKYNKVQISQENVVSTFQRKEISRTPERLCSKYVLNVDRETNQTVIFVSFVVKSCNFNTKKYVL